MSISSNATQEIVGGVIALAMQHYHRAYFILSMQFEYIKCSKYINGTMNDHRSVGALKSYS